MEPMVGKLKKLSIYTKVWWTSSKLSLESVLENRAGMILFTAGKIIRFILFIGFLFIIHEQVNQISGFTLNQMIIFFLMFNILDLFGQLFFRGIYRFRQQVVSGEFDFRLTKPISPLFQALTRHTDVLDIPLLFITIIILINQGISVNSVQWILFILALVSGMILITAIHIVVASLGVITTEVDHTIMIYRDLSLMARVPVDIYTDSIRALLTFVIPIALAFTFPAKAILSLLSPAWIAFSLIFSLVFFWLSLKLWKYALTKYSSASS